MRYVLVLVLLMGVVNTYSQKTWIQYFIADGWSYEYDPVPEGGFGYAKQVKIGGSFDGVYCISKFAYICSSKEIKIVWDQWHDQKRDVLFSDTIEDAEWLAPTKGSTIDIALKGWCKYEN